MRILVNTMQYEFAHGKLPRGDGGWAFQIGSKYDVDKIFFAQGKFSVAKKIAIAEAKKRGELYVEVLS